MFLLFPRSASGTVFTAIDVATGQEVRGTCGVYKTALYF